LVAAWLIVPPAVQLAHHHELNPWIWMGGSLLGKGDIFCPFRHPRNGCHIYFDRHLFKQWEQNS
jgi:hypothetical protein